MSYPLISAHPARGAPVEDLQTAALVALVGIVAAGSIAFFYYRAGIRLLRWAVRLATRISGLPEWAALPSAIIGVSLITAVFGFYWDVATHIDNGRDAGPFANVAHYPILVGLLGIAAGGYLSILVAVSSDLSSTLVRKLRNSPRGAWLVALCGTTALCGFPLDEVWHRLFGQDVTLWGPTHIQMIGGASLSTLGLWVLLAEGFRSRTATRAEWLPRQLTPVLGGAFLLGLSTLQGEFDFGVPQYRLLYHPVLIVIAASIGLVTVRVIGRPFDAIKSVLFFLIIRAAISAGVSPGLGHLTLHFPLYLVEALIVEALATRIDRDALRFGTVSGVLIGTFGLAAEWGWSHVWMPIGWPKVVLAEAAALALLAGGAGGVLGSTMGAALSGRPTPAARGVNAAAALAVVACLAYPGFTDHPDDVSAQVQLKDVVPTGTPREVSMSLRLEPASVAKDAAWFHVLSWQGGVSPARIVELVERSPGEYTTVSRVPIGGSWKTLVRLHTARSTLGLPVYLPEDPDIPARAVPALRRFERTFVADHVLLQREAIVTGLAFRRLGYMAILLIVIAWLWTFARVLAGVRLDSTTNHHMEPVPAA